MPSRPRHAADRRFCVAPMMEWTDRHCRYFMRLISGRALLYTEMVTASAVIHGDPKRLLGFDAAEQPVALQLGGSEPGELAAAARIGEEFGYREINLNIGCPSDRVQSGRFGACLMAEPDLVARCVAAMQEAVALPVTVKCRIGIDDQDSEEDLERFVSRVAQAGCRTFIMHARKAWLNGLSPKQNRAVPPLDYERVYRLKARHPDLEIIINGGITGLEAVPGHLAHVDGVMLGRAAYHDPYLLAPVDRLFFGDSAPAPTREEVMERFIAYAADQLRSGVRLHQMTRHILGLYHGRPGARAFRRILSEQACRPGAGISVLEDALAAMQQAGQPQAVAAE
ncbi:MAG: tRNA dihydrouridine(20/20a) synthase DusA [Alphaproteobacteria bacterium]|nr:MAG: tRNA dihydrouridine(20/20a) synthase DusA [Alphaproteobacteria bacterium]